jgi:hypothetical protein
MSKLKISKGGATMETLIGIIKTEAGTVRVIRTIDGGIKHIKGIK